ncbi:MAG: T9SS type A sorting domain-containing protein, partial [Bacteroidota bacterium]
KTTDFDEAVSYSHLVEVNYNSTDQWDFQLFPNPNTGRHFNLKLFDVTANEQYTVEVIDANGRRIFSSSIDSMVNEAYRFDLAQRLPTGSYLIRVSHPRLGSQAKILLVGTP